MLADKPAPPSAEDQCVFALVVPADHYLRQVIACIDFEAFRARLAEAYSLDQGRPAIDPVRMLKILFLRFHYKLSDRRVMERAQTDMAFRWFLDLPLRERVPDHTGGTYFRKRIGAERFAQIFQELIGQARAAGLVKDRLRLKDATHLLADAADLRPLALAAQVRERLLEAATPFFPDWVAEQRAEAQRLRQTTAESSEEERLAARVEHLRAMLEQLRDHSAAWAAETPAQRPWRRLQRALALVEKLVADQSDPDAQDRLVNAVDPEARVGKHGDYFVGYLLDLSMDADSELITAVNVLPANGLEAADATTLIEQEEAAQGNDVAGLSLDGIGCNGPLLRQWMDPQGLNLDVTVPPLVEKPRGGFGPERFTLKIIDDQHAELTCPSGQSTRQRYRTRKDTGDSYRFKASQCRACPLRAACLPNPASAHGRSVVKNDYEAEYAQVAAKAQTAEYHQTRRIHPKIERKLNEMARHHQARRACYRGLAKVLTQGVLTAWVVNIKRMVRLLTQAALQPPAPSAVRAAVALLG